MLLHADSEDLRSAWASEYSDQTGADAQADLSLRWVHRSFCMFCHAAAQICFYRCFSVWLEEKEKEENQIQHQKYKW